MLAFVLVLFQSSLLVSYSYAITVWYFDAKERAEAKEKYRLGKFLQSRRFMSVSLSFVASLCKESVLVILGAA